MAAEPRSVQSMMAPIAPAAEQKEILRSMAEPTWVPSRQMLTQARATVAPVARRPMPDPQSVQWTTAPTPAALEQRATLQSTGAPTPAPFLQKRSQAPAKAAHN